MSKFITDKQIDTFIETPHLFGHYLGKDKLVDLHSEWILHAWLKKNPEPIMAHRNSYKTTAILFVGAIWYLTFHNPNATNLFIRKAFTEAAKLVGSIRDEFCKKEVMLINKAIYGVDKLKTEKWSTSGFSLATKTDTTPENNIDAMGVGGAITGLHYDSIWPDDIITLKDRTYKTERENTKEFVMELKNIKKEGGRIFPSGTPWHKDDAWTIMPKPIKYPIGTVPIEGFLPHQLEDKKKELLEGNLLSRYSINYDLEHIGSENRIFPEPKYAKWTEEIRPIGWIDPAYSGKNTCALVLIGKNKDGKWLCAGHVWNKNIIDIYDDICRILTIRKAGTVIVESNADKGMSARDLALKWPSVGTHWEKENKHNKIVSYGVQFFNQVYFDYDCEPEFLAQIIDYEEGQEPDDAPDAFSSLIRKLGFKKDVKQSAPAYSASEALGW